MRKIIKKFIILIFIIIFSSNYMSVFAESTDSIKNEIEANKEEMDKIEKEKNQIKENKEKQDSELDKLFDQINEKGKELAKAEQDVAEFQSKIDNMQGEVDIIQESIDKAEKDILQKESLIGQKENELAETQKILDGRIRSYYKMNISSQYIYMLIKSEGLGDLLGNIQAVSKIINIDRDLMSNMKKVQKELSIEKDSLAKRVEKDRKDKEDIIIKQNEVVEAQKEFIVIKDAKQNQMDELLALESEKQNVISSLTNEEIALQEKIGDLVSYNDALKTELDNIFNSINNSNNNNNNNAGNNEDSNGEGFLRPVDGPVTDDFGDRTNPVTLKPGFHYGVDLGSPYYTPIKASKSGVVTYAGWISGYGNAVIIDHGGGVTTLYGHADSLNVSVNQKVIRGETVAFVGSTGMSTGPHLHFEIRFNSKAVNPMDYI